MPASFFITLEGIEGVGKTSAVDCVATFMRDRGHAVLRTREPGGTPIGEKLRALLLDPGMGACALTELLAMFAARAEHLDRVVRPALRAGQCVVCDRFTDASYAYQGGGRGLDASVIETLERLVHADLQPNLTILLDTDAATALGRANTRSAADRFEQEQIAFFERVRAAYLARAARFPQRFVVVDAGRDLQSVQAAITGALEARLQ
jgi:dTMP kinase